MRPLIEATIRRVGASPSVAEDCRAAAYLVICERLSAFDPSRGIPLHGYLSPAIRGAITDAANDCQPGPTVPYRKRKSGHNIVVTDDVSDEDVVVTGPWIYREHYDQAHLILGQLTGIEREIIEMSFGFRGHQMTDTEIGRELGLCHTTIGRKRRAILRRLA